MYALALLIGALVLLFHQYLLKMYVARVWRVRWNSFFLDIPKLPLCILH